MIKDRPSRITQVWMAVMVGVVLVLGAVLIVGRLRHWLA